MALVNNLLDLDKLEAGSMSIHQAQKYLLPLVQGCVDALSLLAQQKQLTVQIQIDQTIAAYMDEERINQVLINILSNAFKYSPRGKTVTVSAFRQNQMIRVEITDQGPGVPPEMLSAVFERFKQVNKSDKANNRAGSGYLQSHNRKTWWSDAVESQSGNGSTFWFTLPINPDALETNAS
jgi:signal transduction histidine kinase